MPHRLGKMGAAAHDGLTRPLRRLVALQRQLSVKRPGLEESVLPCITKTLSVTLGHAHESAASSHYGDR